MTDDQKRRLNGWATHPMLEFLTKGSLTVLAPLIVAAVFALFSMSGQLTELRVLYDALQDDVGELRAQIARIEDRQYQGRP